MQKPRVIKDFVKLEADIQEQIKLNYPDGFEHHLVSFRNASGDKVSALPFETQEKYYMVRMTVTQAQEIIADDEDYDAEGVLKNEIKEEYEEKYFDDEENDRSDRDDSEEEDNDED